MNNPLEIVFRLPSDLTIHPSARDLPELSDDDPQFVALCDDIAANGILTPLDVDKHSHVVDGRHRLRGGKKAKLSSIPVIVRDDEEVIGIILRSLLLRRHYSKSALAYSAVPLFDDVLGGSQKGCAQNARTHSIELIANKFGISKRLYYQARDVYEIFSKDPEFKELMLPQILAGDICLGYVIAGYAGKTATKGKAKSVDKLRLFNRTWRDMANRFDYWKAFDQVEKETALQSIETSIQGMPDDLLTSFQRRVTAEIKQRKAEDR